MEIKIQIKSNCYSICVGKKTEWFEQSYFITIAKLYYDDQKVSFGTMIFHS